MALPRPVKRTTGRKGLVPQQKVNGVTPQSKSKKASTARKGAPKRGVRGS